MNKKLDLLDYKWAEDNGPLVAITVLKDVMFGVLGTMLERPSLDEVGMMSK